ncbi:MAG TPA: ParB/RepB/Spo0J family partition protein [Gemmatimonadales bacterium]|nr:ParB/RepB/Spo0J family partition protein [Gemmatimonadales bacterium]
MPARKRKSKAPPAPRGLEARRLVSAQPPAAVVTLTEQLQADGGAVLATFRDPLGGHWQLLAALPLDLVEPTPYQRDLSPTHVARLANAIDRLGRFLDPVIAVRAEGGKYWTPNGHHRLGALKSLGARAITALIVPEHEVAHRILLLNTEKAHNLRERALEVIRLAEGLARLDDRPEREFEAEFEEAALITLGLCYQQNGRFSGGAYHSVLKRVDKFLGARLRGALETRRERAGKLLQLNEAVNQAVSGLKARGFESPYLKAFVVARINPIRFTRGAKAEFDETIDKMLAAVEKFDAGKIRVEQVARTGGAPAEE